MCICTSICTHMYMHIYVCIHVYIYTYVYIFIYTNININIIRIYEGRVGFCSKRTCTFSGIQFTRHFIEFVVLETNQMVGSNSNVILTRHTCGQRSGMNAGGKRRALAFYFSVRICYMFRMSKCRGESYLGLCMTSGLAKRIPLRSANFRFLNVIGREIRQNLALRSGVFLQVPKSCTDLDLTLLYFLMRGTYSKLVQKNKMLTLGVASPSHARAKIYTYVFISICPYLDVYIYM